MGIMDLSVNQEVMGVQDRFESQVNKLNKFDETDVKGNNNLCNCRKTDVETDSRSLFRDGYSSENLQVDPSLFSYSSFKKAMDLRTHNRTDSENRRTIFDDADYFAKNFFYKLLPITFEQVDETIIHNEHNYSLFSLISESETEEDCSRTMDYSQIKEKNYKRRRTKFRERSIEEVWDNNEDLVHSNENIPNQKELPTPSPESESENPVQPLDLSTAPSVQEQKTDNHNHCPLKEHPVVREENLSSKLKCIQVTITRPDEKENYQPCDMFLNDIARLVPRLINNDCFEIDILDKTGDRNEDFRRHRLYYIIAESTWQLFQSTRERVILTNDHTLGPPVKKVVKDERPTFLVFDQFSLAKCLAEYCEEIGGCFEYTCIEERKEGEKEENVKNLKTIELVSKTIEMNTNDERMVEINAEQVKAVEPSTEKIQTTELNTKLENATAEEITLEAKNYKIHNEITSSDGEVETPELKLKKLEKESDLKATRNEKFEEDTEKKQRNIEETERVDLETNKNDTDAMEGVEESSRKMPVGNLSSNLHRIKTKSNKRQQRKRKKAEKIEKSSVNARNINSNKICKREEKAMKVEKEKTEVTASNNEAVVIALNSTCLKSDSEETKGIEIKTVVEDAKARELEKTKAVELIEKDSKEAKVNEIGTKEYKVFVKKTKSDEQNIKKVIKKQPKKRMIKVRDTKKIKKPRKTTETHEKESLMKVLDDKMGKDGKKQITEIKANKGKENELKEKARIEGNDICIKESETKEKDKKVSKKRGKPTKQVKQLEQSEIKRKKKRPVVRKAKNPLSKNARGAVKCESNPPVPVLQIKTRSKSTSESDSSQKPNKEIQKPKSTAKMSEVEFVRTKESVERITRSGNGIEGKKQDLRVKANGRGVRGTKRKMEEELVEERCLRSRGEKEKVEKMGASGKRKKR